jgi:peptidoglycan/LPS O-acetylase OafA/YrhL
MREYVDRDDPGGFRHVAALDGVRGLAVALIVGAHLWLTNEHPGSRVITLLTTIRMSMWLGVDLFLALSGFLITGILFDTVASPHYLRNFYARRVLRIFPVYYAAIAVLGVLAVTMHFGFRGYWWPLGVFLENTPVWWGRAMPGMLDTFSGHLWSIALEEQFYLLWPLVVMLLGSREERRGKREEGRRRLMWAAGGLSVAALGLRVWLVMEGASFQFTYKMLPCRMDGLLLGGLLALVMRGPEKARVLRFARWVFWPAMGVLAYFALRAHGLDWRTSTFVNSVGYSVAAVAFSSLIAMTLRGGAAARVFSLRPLRWLGKYSYGIYAWHMLLGGLIIPPMRVFTAGLGWGTAGQFLAGAIAGTALSVVIGWGSYWGFEVYFLRLKRFVPYGRVERKGLLRPGH